MGDRTTHRRHPDTGRRRHHRSPSAADRPDVGRTPAADPAVDHAVDHAVEFWGSPERRRLTDRRNLTPLALGIAALVVISAAFAFVGGEATGDSLVIEVTEAAPADDPATVSGSSAAGLTTGDPASDQMAAAPAVGVPALVAEQSSVSCRLRYEIAPGDYWIRLAEDSGVGLAELLRTNSATIETALYPGQTICFPRGARVPAPPTTTVPPTTTAPTTVPIRRPVRPTAIAARPTPSAPTSPANSPATTAPARPTGPAASSETPAEVEALIRSIWPAELADRAVEIARRESRLRPGVYNGHCCYGVFQIHWNAHRSWLVGRGVTSAQHLLDARTNIAMAYQIYLRAGGWGPWRLASDG